MILNKNGDVFEYEGVKYTVGEFIYANKNSDYEGLFGVIKEIRDGDDKDTDNETPDIYCAFENPVIPYDVKEIEKRFSKLYGGEKKLEDIALDEVIMAPEQISVVYARKTQMCEQKVFLLIEDWATDDDEGGNIDVYATFDDALLNLRLKVRKEYDSGLVAIWLSNESGDESDEECEGECEDESEDCDSDVSGKLMIESSADTFEAYLSGFYSSSHFSISIKEKSITGDCCFGVEV